MPRYGNIRRSAYLHGKGWEVIIKLNATDRESYDQAIKMFQAFARDDPALAEGVKIFDIWQPPGG